MASGLSHKTLYLIWFLHFRGINFLAQIHIQQYLLLKDAIHIVVSVSGKQLVLLHTISLMHSSYTQCDLKCHILLLTVIHVRLLTLSHLAIDSTDLWHLHLPLVHTHCPSEDDWFGRTERGKDVSTLGFSWINLVFWAQTHLFQEF